MDSSCGFPLLNKSFASSTWTQNHKEGNRPTYEPIGHFKQGTVNFQGVKNEHSVHFQRDNRVFIFTQSTLDRKSTRLNSSH